MPRVHGHAWQTLEFLSQVSTPDSKLRSLWQWVRTFICVVQRWIHCRLSFACDPIAKGVWSCATSQYACSLLEGKSNSKVAANVFNYHSFFMCLLKYDGVIVPSTFHNHECSLFINNIMKGFFSWTQTLASSLGKTNMRTFTWPRPLYESRSQMDSQIYSFSSKAMY